MSWWNFVIAGLVGLIDLNPLPDPFLDITSWVLLFWKH
jgi:hypothetical protein